MVYVELLVIEDLILNYVVLLGTGILLNRITKFKKIFLSSVLGTIPLIFLFINISPFYMIVISILFSIVMSITAFKYKDLIYTIKNIIYMFLISIFLAGSVYLINTHFLYKIKSSTFNIFILIVLAPIITYIYIKSTIKAANNYSNYYLVDIYLKDKSKITINTYLDTGNKLHDPYTLKPIILISNNLINTKNQNKILVPYNTIDNHGLLECIKPEKIYIKGIGYRKKLLIGLIDEIGIEDADGILNKSLLERI